MFYATRGGGHGFGVVVSLTVRTHPLPELIGLAAGQIAASDMESSEELVEAFLDFYKTNLLGPHWAEQFVVACEDDGKCGIGVSMFAANLTLRDVKSAWLPMQQWAEERADRITYGIQHLVVPGKSYWNKTLVTEILKVGRASPYDPLEPERAFFYNQNEGEISGYWMWYISRYMRMDQILDDVRNGREKILKFARVVGYVGIHTNKAQYGASSWAVKELDNTPMHPTIKDSFGLMIYAMSVSHYSPLVDAKYQNETSGYQDWLLRCNTSNLEECDELDTLYEAFHAFQNDTPGAGSYFNEAHYFEDNFQENFWGIENYEKLLQIKNVWDSNGLFYCHNCVGSEEWEEGGMCRKLGTN